MGHRGSAKGRRGECSGRDHARVSGDVHSRCGSRQIAVDLGQGKDQRPFADVRGYKAAELILAKVDPKSAIDGGAGEFSARSTRVATRRMAAAAFQPRYPAAYGVPGKQPEQSVRRGSSPADRIARMGGGRRIETQSSRIERSPKSTRMDSSRSRREQRCSNWIRPRSRPR